MEVAFSTVGIVVGGPYTGQRRVSPATILVLDAWLNYANVDPQTQVPRTDDDFTYILTSPLTGYHAKMANIIRNRLSLDRLYPAKKYIVEELVRKTRALPAEYIIGLADVINIMHSYQNAILSMFRWSIHQCLNHQVSASDTALLAFAGPELLVLPGFGPPLIDGILASEAMHYHQQQLTYALAISGVLLYPDVDIRFSSVQWSHSLQDPIRNVESAVELGYTPIFERGERYSYGLRPVQPLQGNYRIVETSVDPPLQLIPVADDQRVLYFKDPVYLQGIITMDGLLGGANWIDLMMWDRQHRVWIPAMIANP